MAIMMIIIFFPVVSIDFFFLISVPFRCLVIKVLGWGYDTQMKKKRLFICNVDAHTKDDVDYIRMKDGERGRCRC